VAAPPPGEAPAGVAAPPPGEARAGVAAAEGPPAPRPAPLVVPYGVQLVLLLVGLLALWVAARAARQVVLVFTVASLIALLLNPYVERLRRSGLPRAAAIPLTYLLLVVALVAVGWLLAQPITNQVNSFEHHLPHIAAQANKGLDNFQKFLNHAGVHVNLRKQGQHALHTLQQNVLKGSSSLLSFTTSILASVANAAISLVLILVVSVYFLIYARQIGALVRRLLPAGDGTAQDDYPTRAQVAVSSYVRGQLIFSVAMGTGAGVALWIYGALGIFPDGRTYAFAFGTFFGVMELVPYIGPILGAIPAVLLALFENPISALWVVILFVGIQQLEGHVVAPQIFSHALRINPLLVILALLFGDSIYGIVGALLALPVAAVLRETILYLRRHVVFESWPVHRESG
jgi:predicted PurR-regulated permease PerM